MTRFAEADQTGHMPPVTYHCFEIVLIPAHAGWPAVSWISKTKPMPLVFGAGLEALIDPLWTASEQGILTPMGLNFLVIYVFFCG